MSGSHKTRDKRCHIAAPLLQDVITSTLALHDYTVDHKGSLLHDLPAAEQLEKLDAAGGDDAVENLLRKVAGGGVGGTKKEGSKEVGVFHISHLGGHRYSGVMIVRFSVIVSGKGTKRDWTDVWHLCPPLGSVPPSAQICFPSGSILYYGRVTPKACVAIVEQTILKGKVLPEHLRGGANLTRPTGQTLLDW
jgi:(2Fe-2S) ferredoxin